MPDDFEVSDAADAFLWFDVGPSQGLCGKWKVKCNSM